MSRSIMGRTVVVSIAFIVAVSLAVTWALMQSPTANLAPADSSATSEARQFATAEVYREATRVVAAAASTEAAHETATEEALDLQAEALMTAQVEHAHGTATAQAPPTLTARAIEHEADRASASATAQALMLLATPVFGPAGGTLAPSGDAGRQTGCFALGVRLHNFIAQATFHNPPAQQGQGWDYGLVFSNVDQDTEYRMVLDSTGAWRLNLHSQHFDITNQDISSALDLAGGGSNTLQLYVAGESVQLYINRQYIDTLSLDMFGQDASMRAAHELSVCTNLEKVAANPSPVTYDGLQVWSLP